MSKYFINMVNKIREEMVVVPENLEECSNIMEEKSCSLRNSSRISSPASALV